MPVNLSITELSEVRAKFIVDQDSANEIIGDRSSDEKRYDKEVLRWLRKGKGILYRVAGLTRGDSVLSGMNQKWIKIA